MTTGDESGTSGGGHFRVGPWLAVAFVGFAVAFVNATSEIMENRRNGGDLPFWEPASWEGTSLLIIVAMAPLIGMAVRRWPPSADNWAVPALTHFGLTIPFAAVHIVAIWIVREALYWAVGQRYGFFDDGVVITVLYEWRKDVLVYAAIAAVYWWYLRQAERPPAPRAGDARIEIRDGGAAVFLTASDILWVEAAGNYVEFHTAARTHLVRGTLAAWEARLAQRGFLRVHRSRLVNRAQIASLKPTPAGDIEITLSDGRTLTGSRRYRGALEAPEARQA